VFAAVAEVALTINFVKVSGCFHLSF
jgi:hypothetical protein